MPLVKAKCTQCGADLTVDDSKEAWLCQHCNTPFIVEKAINNYNTYVTNNFAGANVTIQGADPDTLFKRAKLYLSDGDFINAIKYCDKVLDFNPEDGSVYLIKLLAEARSSTLAELCEMKCDLNVFPSYNNVLRFCSSEDIELINKLKTFNEQEYQFQSQIKDLSQQENIIKTKHSNFTSLLKKEVSIALTILVIIILHASFKAGTQVNQSPSLFLYLLIFIVYLVVLFIFMKAEFWKKFATTPKFEAEYYKIRKEMNYCDSELKRIANERNNLLSLLK